MTLRLALSFLLAAAAAPAAEPDRVQLTLDTSEAELVLAIVEKRAAGKEVSAADWQALFASEPYARLKQRETSMRREFDDNDFRRFVFSDALGKRAAALRRTLDAWKQADLRAAAARVLPYLPKDARIRAKVYPVVKPKTNSFVFEAATDPAIFLYLDPDQSASDFANTVAHESHHVGFNAASAAYAERIKALPPNARAAAQWLGAFGEGLAVLAAAGSPEVHPMQDFPDADRTRWEQDLKFFEQHLRQLELFLLDLVDGGFAKPEVADRVALTFFGYRGPWYTVGYRMGVVVEKRFGRAVLVQCMADPRLLLARYNDAANEINQAGKETLPVWSAALLTAVGADKAK
jgi:Putative zinc dependent peptidase (DUF5700)